tara:strand:+ start:102 stop:839 length:738 start_codon:yes stop_codon:yes gene_type:complete
MIFIILPSYNEEKNLVKIIKKIQILNKKFKLTVILVDDASNDSTFKLKNKKYKFKLIYLRHKINKGLSKTLETGFKKVIKVGNNSDVVITLDSDNTHPIHLISKMIKKIDKKNDIAIASRFQKGSKVKGVNFFRKLMSSGAKFVFKIFFPFKNLNDYTCNYRAYKLPLIKKILGEKNFFEKEGFNIAAKILIYLINFYKNLKIAEVPLILSYHKKIGVSKMKVTLTVYLTLKLICKSLLRSNQRF